MFLFDWFYGILTSLGLWQKEAKILLLGHGEVGKKVLLSKLKGTSFTTPRNYPEELFINLRNRVDNEIDFQRFVQQPTSAELSIGKINFKVFDLGGHQTALRVLRDYNAKMDAVVYVVNPCDEMRFPESKRELDALLSDESLANVPFLILVDALRLYGDNADDPFDMRRILLTALGLTNLTTGRGIVNLDANVRPLELFIYTDCRGYRVGFEWLSQYIN